MGPSRPYNQPLKHAWHVAIVNTVYILHRHPRGVLWVATHPVITLRTTTTKTEKLDIEIHVRTVQHLQCSRLL